VEGQGEEDSQRALSGLPRHTKLQTMLLGDERNLGICLACATCCI